MGWRARRTVAGFALVALVVSALSVGFGASVALARSDNPCRQPGNLIFNCSFDGFTYLDLGGVLVSLPEGWNGFIVSGTPDFRPAGDTCPGEGPGCGYPSLWLVSDGLPFTAGVYQQVAVAPGVVYQADIGWAVASAADFERKLGLDPSGGTNPLAPTVVWGASDWGLERRKYSPDLTVAATATGPTMTLFVWVGHPVSHGTDSVYLDAPGLWPDPNQPTATATPLPSLTPTRRPKTAVPTPKPPTSTPTSTSVVTPTSAPSATPTATDTVAPSAVPTATASPVPPSPTPTRTPAPLAVARAASAAPVRLAARTQPLDQGHSPEVLLKVAGGAMAGALLLAGCVAVVWVRGRRHREGR